MRRWLFLALLAVVLFPAGAEAQTAMPPVLTNGAVSPVVGLSTTTFTFSVFYQSPLGYAPNSVSVTVSGGTNTQTFVMLPALAGIVNYSYPVQYVVTTRLDQYFDLTATPNGLTTVFTASAYDGVDAQPAVVTFPAQGTMQGPHMDDPPVLSFGLYTPSSTVSGSAVSEIRRNDPVTYDITYRDVNNEAPADAYPIAWIGNQGGWQFDGGIISSVASHVTLITGTPASGQQWTPSQFKGQPLTWTTGARTGTTDTIVDNTSNMLFVQGDLSATPSTTPVVGDQFALANSSGSVTALDFTAGAFIDTTQNFTPNALTAAPDRLQIVAGNAMGKAYTIAANTAQTIAISGRLLPAPASSDPQISGDVLSGDSYSLDDYLVSDITLIPETSTNLLGLKFNNNPGWTPDEFDGLPVQAETGLAAGLNPQRSYTILRNSTDTLILADASPAIALDGVATGDIFRIGGLYMTGPRGPMVSYDGYSGVSYSASVPGLGLGDHSVFWMAANNPTVNGAVTTYQTSYPAGQTLDGPLVAQDYPPTNRAPILQGALVTPAIGTTSDTYNFSVQYLDPDGDPPGPHDGVEGYIKLFVDTPNGTRVFERSTDPANLGSFWPLPLDPNNPADPAWRTIDSTVFPGFSFAPGTLQPGTHRFHFEASDGWQVTRYPANAENDPAVVVNSRPVLTLPSSGGVYPTQGNAGTRFKFSVIYSDGDNQPPAMLGGVPPAIGVILTLNGVDQTPVALTQDDPTDTNYINGASFSVTATLAPGTYSYRFIASDGIQSANPTLSQQGPTVHATNNPPTLLNGSVTPASSAFANNSFTYSVYYSDPEGDVPGFVNVTILAADGVTVLDTKTLTQADPTATNYADPNGVQFTYTGYHFNTSGTFHYSFSASDGLAAAGGDTSIKTGPAVNNPPVLSSPSVSPLTGPSSGLFTFGVTYTDADNTAPTSAGYVRVVLTPSSGSPIQYNLATQATSGWSTGVAYQLQTQLPAGTYSYHFEASDGLDPAVSTADTPGLTVTPSPTLSSAAVSPASGKSTDTYTYSVTLTNPDGTAPSSIQVFIDGSASANGFNMSLVNAGTPDFTKGAQYQYQTTLASGVHTWFIQAVASNQTIYPAGQTPTSPASGPTVNNPPVLTNALVTPLVGLPTQPFTFQVTYSDADGVAPGTGGGVWLNVTGLPNPVAMRAQPNSAPSPLPDWTKPVLFSVTMAPGTLPHGQDSFYFTASDGIESVRLPTGAGSFSGPRVSSAPQLLNGSVSPSAGSTSTSFVYAVTYQHPDNFAPAPNSVAVLIDGTPFIMLPQSSTNTNYVAGVVYVYSTTLSPGSHTYAFQASDGVNLVSTTPQSGPVVSASGLTINASSNPVGLGSTVTLSGSVIPAAAVPLTITLTRPDGTIIVKNATASSATGQYSAAFIADQVGNWTVSIAETSNTSITATLSPALAVQPATLRVQGGVVDMISSPVIALSGDPADIFGASAANALNIVEWAPALATYEYYGTSISFPPLDPGSAFWIRPANTMTLTLTGSLSDQTQPIAVSVLPGWNQIGSGFVQPVTWAATQVQYNGVTVSLAQAAANNWVRDYAWGYDPVAGSYFLVRGTGGQSTTLDPYRGYWLRALVGCQLLIQPPGVQ